MIAWLWRFKSSPGHQKMKTTHPGGFCFLETRRGLEESTRTCLRSDLGRIVNGAAGRRPDERAAPAPGRSAGADRWRTKSSPGHQNKKTSLWEVFLFWLLASLRAQPFTAFRAVARKDSAIVALRLGDPPQDSNWSWQFMNSIS